MPGPILQFWDRRHTRRDDVEKWAKVIRFAHIKSDWGDAWRRSINPVPRIPCSGCSFTKKDFGRGLPASRSVARETVHPIALGQAPLLDSDPSAGRQADS